MSWKQIAVVRLVALVAILFAMAPAVFAFTAPERTGWVTDEAGILDSATAGDIAAKLSDLQRKTGDEVVVVTLGSLQGASIETWGNVLGESWGIGRGDGKDAGVLLIVAPNDRKVRIAVGYGLGNRISDSIAEAIVADHILPYFRQGDFAQGVKSGVASLVLQLDRPVGSTAAPNATDVERGAYPVSFRPPTFWEWLRAKFRLGYDDKAILFCIVVCIVVFIWMVLNVGNVGSGRRRRRSDYFDDDDDTDSGGFFSSGSGSSSSGSSSGGSFGRGATGSW